MPSTPNTIHVLNFTGDARLEWDVNNPEDVTAARTMFEASIAKGLVAYETTTRGRRVGNPITEFSPDLARVVFVPAPKAIKGGYPVTEDE